MGKVIAKVKKEEKPTKKEELVELLIRELPNLFDSFPRAAVSRPAVERFVEKYL